jgi:glycosyltransferase involved in cell wall biosynthesis
MNDKQTGVLHLTYDMRIGGTEMVIKSIIESSPKDIKPAIYCIESPLGPWGEELRDNGITIDGHARQPGFDWRLIWRLRSYIKKNKPQVIHCHQYTPWVYGTLASIGLGKNIIFTEHGRFYPDSTSWKRKFVNPVLRFFTKHITAISEATKNALVMYEFVPADEIITIYNGIKKPNLTVSNANDLRLQWNIPNNCKIVGTIARLDPIKNQKMMLEAFKIVLVDDPQARLLIIGDGKERKNLEGICGKLNIINNVVFTGYDPKPLKYLALMDIFLLSSLSEGASMTLVEAMALSKPCVVTDAGGNAELIKDSFNGYVTSNDDSQKFADAILKLINNDALIAEFSQNSLLRYNTMFTDRQMVDQYCNLIRNH